MSPKLDDLDLLLKSRDKTISNLVESLGNFMLILGLCNYQGLCIMVRPWMSSKVYDLDLFVEVTGVEIAPLLVEMVTSVIFMLGS